MKTFAEIRVFKPQPVDHEDFSGIDIYNADFSLFY